MYKHCITEESSRRQHQIEQNLLELMLLKPYEQISVKEICDLAGISRKSFYRYFGNKDGALHALVYHTLMHFNDLQLHATTADIQQASEAFFLFWKEHDPLLQVLTNNRLYHVLIQCILDFIRQEEAGFLRLLNTGTGGVSQSRLLFTVSGMVTLVIVWRQDGYTTSVSEMGRILHQLMLTPLISIPTT